MNPLEKLYKALGVEKNASKEEIKKAYKTQVKKHHPDLNGKREDFDLITTAYEILTDPKKKQYYAHTGQVKNESTTNQIYAECLQLLRKILSKFSIEKWKEVNVIGEMIKELKNDQNSLKKTSENLENKIYILEDIRGRFEKKSEGVNIFKDIVSQDIDALYFQLEHNKSEIKLKSNIIEYLEDYTYKIEKTENPVFIDLTTSLHRFTQMYSSDYGTTNTG